MAPFSISKRFLALSGALGSRVNRGLTLIVSCFSALSLQETSILHIGDSGEPTSPYDGTGSASSMPTTSNKENGDFIRFLL
jgi:hypothetical protein